ncbi:hypothetical protein MMC32_003388 [Xylographa parallela]|nr:hypothetical protein [Xylographa parallela]
MPPLGNSWQQERNKPLPPMLPLLRGTGFNYASAHNGIDTGGAETGMSASSTGQGRVDESLGDVGLYSSTLLMTVFAASGRSPGLLKSQPSTPATATFATFQFKEPPAAAAAAAAADRHPSSPDISPRTNPPSGSGPPTLAAPITFSKFYSSSVARPFSGRTHYSGAAYRE